MTNSRGEGATVLFGPLLAMGGIGGYLEKNGDFLPASVRGQLLTIAMLSASVVTICICIYARLQAPQWRREKRSGREFFERTHHTLLGIGVEFWTLLFSGLIVWLAYKISTR